MSKYFTELVNNLLNKDNSLNESIVNEIYAVLLSEKLSAEDLNAKCTNGGTTLTNLMGLAKSHFQHSIKIIDKLGMHLKELPVEKIDLNSRIISGSDQGIDLLWTFAFIAPNFCWVHNKLVELTNNIGVLSKLKFDAKAQSSSDKHQFKSTLWLLIGNATLARINTIEIPVEKVRLLARKLIDQVITYQLVTVEDWSYARPTKDKSIRFRSPITNLMRYALVKNDRWSWDIVRWSAYTFNNSDHNHELNTILTKKNELLVKSRTKATKPLPELCVKAQKRQTNIFP